MKLCLGTVQFGMDYGVCGGQKPRQADAVAMLDYATQNGVDAIDTAIAYGDAELIVGTFLKLKTLPRSKLYLVSKFGADVFQDCRCNQYANRLEHAVRGSLDRLSTAYLDAFICHVPSAVNDEALMEAMHYIRDIGLVKHIGSSVYEVEEAFSCVESGVDFIQVPFSVLDQRMSVSGALDAAASAGIDLHVRSAFVQGLLLQGDLKLPRSLESLRPYLAEFYQLCEDYGVSRRSAAMCFVGNYSMVSHLVFGVDNIDQLKENLEAFNSVVPQEMISDIRRAFSRVPAELVMPNKWRR